MVKSLEEYVLKRMEDLEASLEQKEKTISDLKEQIAKDKKEKEIYLLVMRALSYLTNDAVLGRDHIILRTNVCRDIPPEFIIDIARVRKFMEHRFFNIDSEGNVVLQDSLGVAENGKI